MAEIVIKGFECEICYRECFEEPKSNWSYSLSLKRNNPNVLCFDEDYEFKTVCHECVDRIKQRIDNL